MEHEVFVPVPAASLLSVLGDPARVARCVPSLQRDAGAPEALAGRLKFRVDGHTITYRGAVEVAATGPATVSVTGEGTAARGAGSVKVALTVTLDGSGTAGTAGGGASSGGEPGTTIRYAGTATADGRLVELDAEAVRAAARRLLDRFTQQLVTESLAAHGAPGAAGRESGATASADAPAAAPYGDADSSTGIEARADAETRPDGADADPSSDAPLPPDSRPFVRRLSPARQPAPRPGRCPVRSSTPRCRRPARSRRRHRVHRPGRAARRGGARPAHHDRAERRGGGPRATARPVRPGALARDHLRLLHTALGGSGGGSGAGLRRGGGTGVEAPEVSTPVGSSRE